MEFTADVAANNGFAFNPNHASSVFAVTCNVSGGANYTQRSFPRASAAAWHHYVIVFVGSSATDDMYVYVDGTLQTLTDILVNNGSGNFANSTLNFMSRNNTSLFGAGRLAEVGIWLGLQMTQGEATALAKGYSPLLVHPTSLTHYWPLIGRTSPEIELMEGKTATVNGAVQTDHPRIIYSTHTMFAVDAQNAPAPAFSPAWAHSWQNPLTVAHPADLSDKLHTALSLPPVNQLDSLAALRWLGSATLPVKAPTWPTYHLTEWAIQGPPLTESPGWYPIGGQAAMKPPVYPPPPPLAFFAPSDFAIFPHVPPWAVPVPPSAFSYEAAAAIVERSIGPLGAFVSPPAATVSCSSTLGDLKTRVYDQLDDDGTYYTGNEVRHALNAALNLFVLLTLCIEREDSTFEIGTGYSYTISDRITDFLLPLRVVNNADVRVRPARIHDLDGLSSTWRSDTGAPSRYTVCGYDTLFITPIGNAGDKIRIRYAATPTQLSLDTDTPEIPADQQPHLVDYACWWLRLKEGGQELANAAEWLKRFIDAARKYGDYVRRRSYGQKYDHVPFDLARFDLGRLDIKLPRKK